MHFRKDWIYLSWKNYLYINISNPRKTLNKIKKVFKPLKCYFRYSFKEYDYNPVLWCRKPSYIQIMTQDVSWKDKYSSPRFEVPPYIWIHIYKMNLVWYWSLSPHQFLKEDEYWEQALWYLYYAFSDLEKAKKSWPWIDTKTEKSSWSDEFLMK